MKISKVFIGISVITSIFISALSIIQALIMGNLIDGLLNNNNIMYMFAMYIFSFIIEYFIKLIRLKKGDPKFIDFKLEKQKELINKLYVSDYLAVKKLSIGELYNSTIELSNNYFESLKVIIYNHIPNVLLMISAFIICLFISWQLTIMGFMVIPIMALLGSFIIAPISKKIEKISTVKSDFNSFVENTLLQIDIIKVYKIKNWIMSKYIKQAQNVCNVENKIALNETLSDIFGMLMGAIPYVVFFIGGGFLVHGGIVTVGLFYIFITVFGFVYQGLPEIQSMMMEINKLKAFNNRLEKINSLPTASYGNKEDEKINTDNGITISNISFSYNEKQIFTNYSAKIKSNSFTIIKGDNGTGKSTLLKILATIQSPDSGNVYFENLQLNNSNLDIIRDNSSFVSQDSFVFEGTLKENITLGDNNITDKLIKEVCEIVLLDKWIEHLPNSYNYNINEGGNNISAGQMQRINIARALCRKPKYIFLDEITSNLDIISRKQVLKIMKDISSYCTVVYVTHNQEDLDYANEIITLENSEVLEND